MQSGCQGACAWYQDLKQTLCPEWPFLSPARPLGTHALSASATPLIRGGD